MNVTNVGISLATGAVHHSQSIASHKKHAGNVKPFNDIKQGSYQHAENVERVNHFDLSVYKEVEKYPEQSKINDLLSLSVHV